MLEEPRRLVHTAQQKASAAYIPQRERKRLRRPTVKPLRYFQRSSPVASREAFCAAPSQKFDREKLTAEDGCRALGRQLGNPLRVRRRSDVPKLSTFLVRRALGNGAYDSQGRRSCVACSTEPKTSAEHLGRASFDVVDICE